MKAVIQRVKSSSVTIDGVIKAAINKGLLVFVGIEDIDTEEDIQWLCKKIVNMRIFNDEDGVMNYSVKDIEGEILIISQFTLHASTKKGNRPSYLRAAKPEVAVPLYNQFIEQMEKGLERKVMTGKFGADMKVALTNDGPVSIIIDSKNKE